MTFCQFSLVQPLYWLQNSSLFLVIFGVRNGCFKGFREGSFKSLLKRWRIVLKDNSANSGTDRFISLDDKKGFSCISLQIFWSVRGVVFWGRPHLFIGDKFKFSLFRLSIRLTEASESPNHFAISLFLYSSSSSSRITLLLEVLAIWANFPS